MPKVRLTIRCVKCNHVEQVVAEAWGAAKTTCGCNGPWRLLQREKLTEPPPAGEPKAAAAAPAEDRGR